MKFQMKIATVITIVLTVVYAVILFFLDQTGNLPVETTVMVMVRDYSFKLPFEVSAWWFLLTGPIALQMISYMYNQIEIIGREPQGKKNYNLDNKHSAKTTVFCTTAVSLAFLIWFPIVGAITMLFTPDTLGGPVSMLADGIVVFLCAYIGLGFWLEFATPLGWGIYDIGETQSIGSRYMSMSAKYVKMGYIKTFPFLVGLTCGFMLRVIIIAVNKFFKAIKITFRREPFAG